MLKHRRWWVKLDFRQMVAWVCLNSRHASERLRDEMQMEIEHHDAFSYILYIKLSHFQT
jgi:hypothetical protein